jgi:radical SAM superfamily enzyme YgiQ (UPF0313 family)
VSPESANPTVPSSQVSFKTIELIAVIRVFGMITGFFSGVETGTQST